MEEQFIENEEIEIDLVELAGVLLSRIKLIILCLLAGACIAGGITKFLITPQYTGTSMIFILTKTTSVTSLADIQLGSELTKDFTMLATSRPTLETVIEELKLDMTAEELGKTITITNPADTRILQIDVENPDAGAAAEISNALANATADSVADIMSTDRPSIVEKAVVPEEPSSPNLIKNILFGAIAAAVLCMAAVIAAYLLDDTIKTEDDVTKYLGLNTLAALPVDDKAEPAGVRNVRREAPAKRARPDKKKSTKGAAK